MTVSSDPNDIRRTELGYFLRSKRRQLNPEDVGMPGGGRRRTPGLRREEVAVLANVGVSWYAQLEQGKDITPSSGVLASIADALKLNPLERAHLEQLSGQRDFGFSSIDCAKNENVQRIVSSLGDLPAVCLDRYMNVFAANPLAAYLFDCTVGRNCLESFFVETDNYDKYQSRSDTAQMLVSQFRRNAARYPGDLRFADIARSLSHQSADFAELWSAYTVGSDLRLQLIYTDDAIGSVNFESTTLEVSGETDLNVLVYLPRVEEGSADVWNSVRQSFAAQGNLDSLALSLSA